MVHHKLKIGISACLTGQTVRYDGSAKLQPQIVAFFAAKAELIPICPEVGCGLGVPRETIRLEGQTSAPRLVTTATRRELTGQMQAWMMTQIDVLAGLTDLKGFIFKARSPSCGYRDTPVWQPDGTFIVGQGLFAQAISRHLPRVVCADEAMLASNLELEQFWEQVQAIYEKR